MSNQSAVIGGGDAQMQAFNDGMASQQEIGRQAAEQHQKDLDQMRNHQDLMARFMTGNISDEEFNSQPIQDLIKARRGALGAALRRIQA